MPHSRLIGLLDLDSSIIATLFYFVGLIIQGTFALFAQKYRLLIRCRALFRHWFLTVQSDLWFIREKCLGSYFQINYFWRVCEESSSWKVLECKLSSGTVSVFLCHCCDQRTPQYLLLGYWCSKAKISKIWWIRYHCPDSRFLSRISKFSHRETSETEFLQPHFLYPFYLSLLFQPASSLIFSNKCIPKSSWL